MGKIDHIDMNTIGQVGFIVRDVEKTKEKFAKFFGVPVPPTADGGPFEISQVEYKGEPAPSANCKMAFCNLRLKPDSIFQVELIEPNEHPSVWRDFLDEKGEGLHHLAFRIRGFKDYIEFCTENGMELLQKGEYGDGMGRYAYFDATKDLKCFLEILEDDYGLKKK